MCFRSLSEDDASPRTAEHREECILHTLDLLQVVKDETDRSGLIALLAYFDNAALRDGITPTNPLGGPNPWLRP